MLRIVESDDFYNNPCVELEYHGFEFPSLEKYPELKKFNVKTYAVFTKYHSTEMAFKPVNLFFEGLSIEQQKMIVKAMALSNHVLHEEYSSSECAEKLGNLLDTLDKVTGLCDSIRSFILAGNIHISDMSEAGSRPQDRKAMTFVQDEAVTMTAMAILAKMYVPIIGEFIYQFSTEIESNSKELVAYTIFTQINQRKYKDLTDKLSYYIKQLVIKRLHEDPCQHFKGNTSETITLAIVAGLFIKKYPSVDLYRPDGNIVKYSASCAKSNVESLSKTQNIDLVKVFADPNEQDLNEETNNSRLETEATTSAKPADCIPIAKFSAEWAIEKTIEQYELEKYGVRDILDWYSKNPGMTTPLMTYIVTSYFGSHICGGSSILYIGAIPTIKLAAVLQTILMVNKSEYLVHGLTTTYALTDKTAQTADFIFMNTWKSTLEYSQCKRVIAPGFGEISWDSGLKDIAASLVAKGYIYHTAPMVYEYLNQENKNDKIFADRLPFMCELMKFIQQLWENNSVKEK